MKFIDYFWHLDKTLQLIAMMNHSDWIDFSLIHWLHIPSHIIACHTVICYQAEAIKGVKYPQPYIFTKPRSCSRCRKRVVWIRQGRESSVLAERPRSIHATGDCETTLLIMACRIFQSLQLIKWWPIMIPFQILAVFSWSAGVSLSSECLLSR